MIDDRIAALEARRRHHAARQKYGGTKDQIGIAESERDRVGKRVRMRRAGCKLIAPNSILLGH